MQRIALLVGVDDYHDDRIVDLHCCSRDAQRTAFTLGDLLGFDEALALTQGVSTDKVMEQLRRIGRRVKPGDLFVFFFAGHGKTVTAKDEGPDQLFLLPQADAELLSNYALAGAGGILSWRVLKALTDRWTGVQRLFIFDACRLPLEKAVQHRGDGAAAAHYEGAAVFRGGFKVGGERRRGEGGNEAPLAVINSCDDGGQAEELLHYPGGGHGKFTAALLEDLQAAAREGRGLRADAEFTQRLHQRMQKLGSAHGGTAQVQQPLWAGDAVVLAESQVRHAAPSPASDAPGLTTLQADFERQLAAGQLQEPWDDCCQATLVKLQQAGLDAEPLDALLQRLRDERAQQAARLKAVARRKARERAKRELEREEEERAQEAARLEAAERRKAKAEHKRQQAREEEARAEASRLEAAERRKAREQAKREQERLEAERAMAAKAKQDSSEGQSGGKTLLKWAAGPVLAVLLVAIPIGFKNQKLSTQREAGPDPAMPTASAPADVRYRARAEAGDRAAMRQLGWAYELGQEGLDKDEVQAVMWFRRAAEAGDGGAMNDLGSAYAYGNGGLSKDDAQAVAWYRKGAEAGDGGAMANLGVAYWHGKGGLSKDEVQAVAWYRKGAEARDGTAMNNLGVAYEHGLGGLSQDVAQAVAWYRKGAEAKSREAMVNFGGAFDVGKGGLSRDAAQALAWYRKAAEAGSGRAMYMLGIGYEDGLNGLSKDVAQALTWYRKGAEAGDEAAKLQLKRLGK